MTILFDAKVPVNSNTLFGCGIFSASAPVAPRPVRKAASRRFEPTEADWTWLREDNARRERDAENAMFEMMAGESAALDRLERGIAL